MNYGTSFRFGSIEVKPAERKDIKIKISELYVASPVYIPLTIVNGARKGPTVFITAALHGDELNGIEIIRQLRSQLDPNQLSGTLLLVAISNPVSFILQSRELPDGRDLNRSFPGKKMGSIASYMAYEIFNKIVTRSNYGIDLHTAGHGRINLPHIRADLRIKKVQNLAFSFGAEVILDMEGHEGTLRYEVCRRGIPIIVYEAGQPMRFEHSVIIKGLNGIKNTLASLGMYPFKRESPKFQIVVKRHRWIRSTKGGILIVHVKPGDVVKKGDLIAYTSKPFGTEVTEIKAPFSGVVIGTTTIPTALPGSAVCHISQLDGFKLRAIKRIMKRWSSS